MQETSDHSMKPAGREVRWQSAPTRDVVTKDIVTWLLAIAVLAFPLAACADGSGAMEERPADGVNAAVTTDQAESAEEGEAPGGEDEATEEDDAPVLVGEVSRSEVESAVPEWVTTQMESAPDVAAVEALAGVEPGAAVTVYLGTWCSDSQRELARLWRGFDDAGLGVMVEPPFDLTYVAVDRDKVEPAGRLEGVGLEFVPTFVVVRGGEEVGRVVEIAPNGIEHDLLALLSGEAEGVVSGREDLGGAGRDAILGSDEDTGGEAETGSEPETGSQGADSPPEDGAGG